MYRLSPKQILLISLTSALLSAVAVAVYDRHWREAESVAATNPSKDPAAAAQGARATDPSRRHQPILPDDQNNIDVYDNVSPGVVNITSTSYREDFWGLDVYPEQGTGSGSIIDQKGNILTNYHVVKDAQELKVTLSDKTTYDATLVGADPDNDLAVINISARESKLHVVPMGGSEDLRVGQKVLAIGNPFALDLTLTRGIISGLGRPLKTSNGRTVENVIQTDASINPGNSGGPLLNANGEMIGVNTAIYSPSGGSVGIGFAVPIETAKRILPDLIAYGRVLRPWLGIATRMVTPQIASQLNLGTTEGLIITGVLPNGPADKAGIVGSTRARWHGDRYQIDADILTKIDNQKIRNDDDLYKTLNNYKTNDSVDVEIFRQGRSMHLKVQLEAKPTRYSR